MDKLYTTKEVAGYLGVSPETVRGWIHKGKLKAKKGYGGRNYITMSDLNKFVETKPKYHRSLYNKHLGYRLYWNRVATALASLETLAAIKLEYAILQEFRNKKKEES